MDDQSIEGWYLDPYGIHEQRWMSGGRPTRLVRDAGTEATMRRQMNRRRSRSYPQQLLRARSAEISVVLTTLTTDPRLTKVPTQTSPWIEAPW
jgi:hypothetical protein